ncbi:hypothetical protein GCM10008112_01810 [Flexivirga endophytica]|nr:hypothetical protein GCM10008112_01810 [Flexivirga endophytica]
MLAKPIQSGADPLFPLCALIPRHRALRLSSKRSRNPGDPATGRNTLAAHLPSSLELSSRGLPGNIRLTVVAWFAMLHGQKLLRLARPSGRFMPIWRNAVRCRSWRGRLACK